MIERNILDDAIRSWLANQTGKKFGLGRVPGTAPARPYGVIWPSPGPVGEGSWAQPQEDGCFWYSVHCIGDSAEQSQWLADQVYHTFLEKDSGGNYLHVFAPAGLSIHWRLDVAREGTTRSGDTLFDTIDRYEVRAS